MKAKVVAGLVVGAGLMISAGCGKSAPACSGSSCLPIAGTWQANITQSPGTTCKYITYGSSSFTTEMDITQQGSSVTATFPNFLGVTLPGTLRTDGSADFSQDTTANVDTTDGSQAFLYNDSSTLNLQFTQGGSGITASGTKQDILAAQSPSPSGDPDSNCDLQGAVTASML